MRITKRGFQWIATAVLLVAVLLTAFTGVVFLRPILQATGAEVTGAPTTVNPALFEPPPSPVAEPAHGTGLITGPRTPQEGPVPDGAEMTARVQDISRSAAADGADEVSFAVSVIDVETGTSLVSMNDTVPLMPASNTKTLTVVSLLNAVPDDLRFATRVLQPTGGEIVLVGGGDPMLRAAPAGPDTYPGGPSLTELADLTAAALSAAGDQTVSLSFDASLFADSGWNETWPDGYRSQVTQISALWVDTGRVDGVRSLTPALDAATLFAELLGERGITVVGEPAEVTGAEGGELARVESLPVHVLAEQAMQTSDNSWTEVLGFQLALATGRQATFPDTVAAIEEQLRELGVWRDGAVLFDGSGLSRRNLVPAGMLAAVNRHIVEEPRLQVILDGMPVAGVTGTLRQRFNDSTSAPARGIAKGKTGSLTGVATLAGTTITADDRLVSYAAVVNGSTQPWEARVWIDRVVGTVTSCGC